MFALPAALASEQPSGRYSHCAAMYQNHMIIYGGRGFTGGSSQKRTLTTLSDTWALDLDRLTWSLLDDGSEPSEARSDTKVVGSSVDQGTKLAATAGNRFSHACVMAEQSPSGTNGYEGAMLVFGGLVSRPVDDAQATTDVAGICENDVWKLALHGGSSADDVVTSRWVAIDVVGTAPSPRRDHTAVAGGKSGMLVFGGCIGSAAHDDVWLLRPLSTATDRGEAYAWTELARPEAVVRMGRQLTEPEPPVVAAAVNDGGARASGSDEGVSPPPTTPAESGSGEPAPPLNFPAARCGHSAVGSVDAAAGRVRMLIFGGREPLPFSARDDSWRTLADGWFLELDVAAQLLVDASRLEMADQPQLLLNRSDHAAVAVDNDLYLFGGLYTDRDEDTIYIMKDFLRVPLEYEGPPAVAERLDWGPAWRFDHTMVLAPRVRDRSGGGEVERLLVDAPVVFGGGGGMDIFSDIWVFDMAAKEWIEVSTRA